MKKKNSLLQKYQEIITNQSFEELDPYRNVKGWEPMSTDEKEILARLFVAQGAHQLDEGDERAQESFALAEQAAPKSAKVFIEIGDAFSKKPGNSASLLAACHAYERACQLEPMSFDAWEGWGSALMRLGHIHSDQEAFEKAQSYFQKAETLVPEGHPLKRAQILHKWGQLWAMQGIESGEAMDLHNALDCFRRCEALGFESTIFWNDYAIVMKRLSYLMGRPDLLQQALDYHKKAYALEKKDPNTLFYLAEMFSSFYPQNNDEKCFTDALKCFRAGAEVCADRYEFWLTWACLLCYHGKTKQDIGAIETSLDKFARADKLNPNHPITLLRWGEALRITGALNEDIDKLKDAQNKIAHAVELDSNIIEAWYLWGVCLCELGRYFGEESYYLQAMDKLRTALNLNQQDSLIWYGLAQVYLALGDLIGDVSFYEKANGAFSRCEEFGGLSSPQYWNNWGVSLMKIAEVSDTQKVVEEAIEKFEKAIAHAEKIEAEWLYNYGCAFDFLGDLTDEIEYYEKSIQILIKTIELEPEFLPAYYNAALAFSHLGEVAQDMEAFCKACELFQTLISKDSEDEMAWNDWGIALMHLAQILHEPSLPHQSEEVLSQAEEKFLQALRLGNKSAYYNLACLYSIKNQLPLAMQYIEKADEHNVLPYIEDMMHDEWLNNLRQTRAFRGFMTNLANRKQL